MNEQVGYPRVRGRCPSCGSESLFLGANGYVTCSVIGCKDPGAPTDVLAIGKVAAALPAAPEPSKDDVIEALQQTIRLLERRLTVAAPEPHPPAIVEDAGPIIKKLIALVTQRDNVKLNGAVLVNGEFEAVWNIANEVLLYLARLDSVLAAAPDLGARLEPWLQHHDGCMARSGSCERGRDIHRFSYLCEGFNPQPCTCGLDAVRASMSQHTTEEEKEVTRVVERTDSPLPVTTAGENEPTPSTVSLDAIDYACGEVERELRRAITLFGPFRCGHEGWAVIREEVDELWDEIKNNKREDHVARQRKEAIQIAAMALRYVVDLGDKVSTR